MMNTLETQIVGGSRVMQELREQIRRVAQLGDTVLIQGERGTGKELVAHALHQESRRRGGPLVVVDCSVLVESVFESDLFGHERGAFTGAHKMKPGLVEDAQGGTAFFDEISHLQLTLQGKLLRFLESKTVRRVGGRFQRNIDARLVVATNQDLGRMAEEGRFLPDLLDRLNILRIQTPPLREHPEDIPELIRHFSQLHKLPIFQKDIPGEVMTALCEHDWPGNVRQLLNVLRRVNSENHSEELLPETVLRAMA